MTTQSDTRAAAETSNRALTAIGELVQSGRPLIYLLSPEEGRIAGLLRDVAREFFAEPVPVFTWTLTEGMREDSGKAVGESAGSARAGLDFISAHDGAAVFHLKDFHEPMRASAEVRRRLRDLYDLCRDTGKFLFISSPVRYLPDELSRDIVLLELRTPDFTELVEFVKRQGEASTENGVAFDSDGETVAQLARALQGLTLDEARHALRRAVAARKRLDRDSVRHLLEEKHLLVQRTGVIEYVSDAVPLGDLGGFSTMKKWLSERRKLFEMRDDLSADIVPKGLLVMGVSGCGKSLAVKSIASSFDLPLYRIDMIEIFSGRHGNSEAAFAGACRIMEEMSPAVVWFDEIENCISVNATGENSDQGRMFAFFLTWMQEKTRGLFVAATANRIDLLPAEMIRKGRFDEVFFVDLPEEAERLEICKIHLRKRGIDPEAMQIDRLRQFTRGWTGAEIEQCVVSAITTARLEDRDVAADDLLNMTAKIVPLSRTMKEQVEHIRAWALERAVRAAPRSIT